MASFARAAVPGPRRTSGFARSLALAFLALAPGVGCTREFFREWANQDASEAVFEKSRDPRWRLEVFSIEPPPLARYASPYDPDRPPAPPDDYAAQSLSPVPQWPDYRLIVPVEGTGYLDMMDAWQRQSDQQANAPAAGGAGAGAAAPRPAAGRPAPGGMPLAPLPGGAPVEPPPPGPSPFATPPPNSGPNGSGLTPNTIPGSMPVAPPSSVAPAGASPATPAPQPETPPGSSNPPVGPADLSGSAANLDPPEGDGVQRASYQEVTITPPASIEGLQLAQLQPGPGQPGIPQPPPVPPLGGPTRPPRPRRDLPTPAVGQDPSMGEGQEDISRPVPRRDLAPEEYKASEAATAEIAGIFVPGEMEFDVVEISGFPKESKPYVITIEQAFALGLINARVYQFNLENVYIAALNVALQRFAFEPQFIAGMSPQTQPVGGVFPVNPINQFFYSTAETGAQASRLNLGTVAGVGKFFVSGGRLLTGFANATVFNFIGKSPRQPTVQSSLPLSIVQPLLRGGGRAVALENLTQAERTLLYAIRSFAKFRQEFTVAILVGGNVPTFGTNIVTQGFTGGGNVDPVTGFLNVLQDLQVVENDRKNIAAYAQLLKVYKELVEGEASGLSQLQVDQIDSGLQSAETSYAGDRLTYRNDLDSFRMQLGMPPDVPMVCDRHLTAAFKDVYDRIDVWQGRADRTLEELADIADDLPDLQDVVIDGRSVLGIYPLGAPAREENFNDLLLAAERVALEHRLDLMNTRAQLYDAWRQIRVASNALQGVLTVSLTNQVLTPPTTTNPFAFLDQAKQFSLVLNTELPLIRVSERNNFREALIGYERQRRTLQAFEDNVKLFVRNDIRNLHFQYLNYYISRRNFVLTVRQKDQAFEQIIAPPGGAQAGGTNAALQTTNLVQFQGRLINLENSLVSTWLAYQLQRLQLYRDLGTLPYDEWEAFGELFPEQSSHDGARAAGIVPGSS